MTEKNNNDSSPLPNQAQMLELMDQVDMAYEEVCHFQRTRLLKLARQLQPNVTFEDVLNPQTFPALANDPEFSFEDGYLAGLLAGQTAIRAKVLIPIRDGRTPDTPLLPADSPYINRPNTRKSNL